MPNLIMIGTYTGAGTSQGIYGVSLGADGHFSDARLLTEARDPSYLALSADGQRLYAVSEQTDMGDILSFEKRGENWQQTGCTRSEGGLPCHLALSPDENKLAVANYQDGVVTICNLHNGAVTQDKQILPGCPSVSGGDRQTISHAHMCLWHEGKLLVCDLGCDIVREFCKRDGKWQESAPLLRLPKSSGPRHMALGKCGTIYVLGELNSRLHVFGIEGGSWKQKAELALISQECSEMVGASAIHMSKDGKRLICSTRQNNGLCVLDIDESGMLHLIGRFDSGVRIPRDVAFVGDYIVCAGQESGSIKSFKLSGDELKLMDSMDIGAPVCLINA